MELRNAVIAADDAQRTAVIGRLARVDRRLQQQLDALRRMEERLDRALVYEHHPSANLVLARVYRDRLRTRWSELAARVRRARQAAREAIAEADRLLPPNGNGTAAG